MILRRRTSSFQLTGVGSRGDLDPESMWNTGFYYYFEGVGAIILPYFWGSGSFKTFGLSCQASLAIKGCLVFFVDVCNSEQASSSALVLG